MSRTKFKSMMFNLILLTIYLSLSEQMIVLRDQLNYQTGTNYVGTLPKTKQSICDKQNSNYSGIKTYQNQQKNKQDCYSPRVYNPETQSCQCLYGTIYYQASNRCLCPAQKPLWTGKNCIQCPFKVSSTNGKVACSLCPQGFIAKQISGNVYCEGVRVK